MSQLGHRVLLPGAGCRAGERDLAASGPGCSLSCPFLVSVSSWLNNSLWYSGRKKEYHPKDTKTLAQGFAKKATRITRQKKKKIVAKALLLLFTLKRKRFNLLRVSHFRNGLQSAASSPGPGVGHLTAIPPNSRAVQRWSLWGDNSQGDSVVCMAQTTLFISPVTIFRPLS